MPGAFVADSICKMRQRIRQDVADQIRVHPEVLVNNHVAKARDRRPRNLGMGRLEIIGQRLDGFPDDSQIPRTAS